MKIRSVSIDQIKPYPGNPRIIDKAVSRVAKSLQEFGFNQPIVVDREWVVIVGHARLEAAKSLGLGKVPVLVADHLSEEQAKAYRLADNKTGEFAVWDDQKLLDELRSIIDLGSSIEITGFSESEMLAFEMQAKALLEATTPASSNPNPATSLAGPVPSPAPVSAPGDPDPSEVGLEPENDHDSSEDDEPSSPAMVRFEAVLDEEQRRAVVAALNKAKEAKGLPSLGIALHVVCLEWMESRA